MITIKMARYSVVTFLILALLLDGSFCDANGGGATDSGGAFGGGAGGGHGSGSGGGAGGEFKGLSNGGKIDITVSYEIADTGVKEFFTELSSTFLTNAYKCGVVNFHFKPCANPPRANGKFQCNDKALPTCKSDQFHACAAKLNEKDQEKVGKFAMCAIDGTQDEQCAQKNQMDVGQIKTCVDKKDGDKYCQGFLDEIANDGSKFVPEIKFSKSYNKEWNQKAYDDWSKTFCDMLKDNNLKCQLTCP